MRGFSPLSDSLEPDASNIAGLLLDMLQTEGAQRRVDVLVTTHNPGLRDAMGPEMLPFITVVNRHRHSGCSTLTLLEDVEQLPKLLAQGPIGRLFSQGLIEQSLAASQVGKRVRGANP